MRMRSLSHIFPIFLSRLPPGFPQVEHVRQRQLEPWQHVAAGKRSLLIELDELLFGW